MVIHTIRPGRGRVGVLNRSPRGRPWRQDVRQGPVGRRSVGPGFPTIKMRLHGQGGTGLERSTIGGPSASPRVSSGSEVPISDPILYRSGSQFSLLILSDIFLLLNRILFFFVFVLGEFHPVDTSSLGPKKDCPVFPDYEKGLEGCVTVRVVWA